MDAIQKKRPLLSSPTAGHEEELVTNGLVIDTNFEDDDEYWMGIRPKTTSE